MIQNMIVTNPIWEKKPKKLRYYLDVATIATFLTAFL